jgi:hypothetical protein
VRLFLAQHPGNRSAIHGRTDIEAFLGKLTATPGTEEWQVQQARDALEVYYERFRGIALESRQHTPAPVGDTGGKDAAGVAAGSAPVAGHAPDAVNWPLLDAKVRERLRVGHYSYRTEQTYLGWIQRFVVFHRGRKPSMLEAKDVSEFLRHLAMDAQVASSTQNQALNAVAFLYREVVSPVDTL